MVLSDVAFFSAFTADIEQVVNLTGNSGKRVRRVLEQYMPLGVVDAQLAAPEDLSILAFAAYVLRVRDACEMANEALVNCRDCGTNPITFAVSQISIEDRSYRLQIKPGTAPESMRARQGMLDEISFGLARLRVMLDPSLGLCAVLDCQSLEESLFDEVYSDSPEHNTPESRKIGIEQFQALVGGDYSSIDVAPMTLVSLAGVLNPTVDVEVSKAIARDNAAMDAVWEDIARLDDSKDRFMPLSSLFSPRAHDQHA